MHQYDSNTILWLPSCLNVTTLITTKQQADPTGVEFDEFFDFAGCDVDSNGIVHLDQWIRITNGPTVTSDDTWHAFQANQHLLDFAQLVLYTAYEHRSHTSLNHNKHTQHLTVMNM